MASRPARVTTMTTVVKPTEVIEIVGTSSESWAEAARDAVESATRTASDLCGAEIVKQDVIIENGIITQFRVWLAVSFRRAC